MITEDAVMPLLVDACPSYVPKHDRYVAENYVPGQERLLYAELGDFAAHLVELCSKGATNEFGNVGSAIERLHKDGDESVREAATVGLLEGIQNHAEHAGVDEDWFVEFLGPESRRWWKGLQAFWAKRIPTVTPID